MQLNKFVTLLSISFFSLPISALECQWWQTKVKAHAVQKHQREGNTVSKHPRQEHCREKWKGADIYIKQFKNVPIEGWPHKETFKTWTGPEIETLLKVFASAPDWAGLSNYEFYRALKSDVVSNPARSEITYKSIILYDSFFSRNDKLTIIVHESAHHLYRSLGPAGINEFTNLSGWQLETNQKRQVFERPPERLIKPDSAISKEEDFANHLEEFYRSSNSYQKSNPTLYKFMNGRFK
ncbi:MAG TPA: hypothetical protein VNJ01_18315 [Bacteriovoracaceae bacterium]|nr:hypothetical protein [Bacteriovoracaceae bacterium]